MAPRAEQVLDQGSGIWGQQGEQKGVDQTDHEQELEPVLPEPEAGALHGQISLAGAVAHLHLPAPSVG